jgi:hypothetical protein
MPCCNRSVGQRCCAKAKARSFFARRLTNSHIFVAVFYCEIDGNMMSTKKVSDALPYIGIEYNFQAAERENIDGAVSPVYGAAIG